MRKYNLMERSEDTKEAVEQMTELRLSLSLITKALISEEPNFLDGFDIVWNLYSDESFQAFFSGIDDMNLTANGFLYKSIKILDKFWEINFEGLARLEPKLPLIEKTLKRLFKEYNGASFQTYFDQMGTCYDTLNSLFKDRDEWHEWLFSMYKEKRNANLANTPSSYVNDHH